MSDDIPTVTRIRTGTEQTRTDQPSAEPESLDRDARGISARFTWLSVPLLETGSDDAQRLPATHLFSEQRDPFDLPTTK